MFHAIEINYINQILNHPTLPSLSLSKTHTTGLTGNTCSQVIDIPIISAIQRFSITLSERKYTGNFHFAHPHDVMEQVRQSTLEEGRLAIVEVLKFLESHFISFTHSFMEHYLMHEKQSSILKSQGQLQTDEYFIQLINQMKRDQVMGAKVR